MTPKLNACWEMVAITAACQLPNICAIFIIPFVNFSSLPLFGHTT